jgi:protein TonB
MNRVFRNLLLCSCFLSASLFFAEDSARKIVKKVAPEYPEIAKRVGVYGLVKVEVTIAADGSVRNTKVMAGHPMLVQSATTAISRWHYEPGKEEVQTVTVDFHK